MFYLDPTNGSCLVKPTGLNERLTLRNTLRLSALKSTRYLNIISIKPLN